MTIIAMLMLPLYLSLFAYLTGRFGIEPMMQIAVAHIIFNLVGTILFYPFIKQMVWIIKKTIRGDEKERIDINTEDFDSGLAHDLPTAALGVAKRATLKMGEISTEVIETAKQYLNKENKVNLDSISQLEDIINNFDTKITDYLLLISKEKLNEDDIEQNSINLQIVKNLERIGDLTMNLGEFFDLVYDARESFSQQALDEINNMFDLVIHMLNRSLKIYEHNDFSLLQSVKEDETYLDLLESKARNNHFARMRSDECPTTIGGSVYVDILGTLERMGDHAENIARSVFNVHTQHEARRAAEIEEQN